MIRNALTALAATLTTLSIFASTMVVLAGGTSGVIA
jgi:hypothetical protein